MKKWKGKWSVNCKQHGNARDYCPPLGAFRSRPVYVCVLGGGRGAQLLTPAKWVSACVNEGQSSPGRLMYSKTNPPS